MPQYDAFGKLKRMAFSYGGETVTLLVNPQNYEYQQGQRATIIKTQSDNVIEQYGPDFPIISISGNTGYRKEKDADTGQYLTGKGRFDRLKNLILGYQGRQVDGASTSGDLYFYNYTDDLSYTVTIPSGGFQYTRNVDTTLLYNYSISLVVLGGSDQPNRSNIVNPIVGTGTGSSVTLGTSVSSQRAAEGGITSVDTGSKSGSKGGTEDAIKDAVAGYTTINGINNSVPATGNYHSSSKTVLKSAPHSDTFGNSNGINTIYGSSSGSSGTGAVSGIPGSIDWMKGQLK